MISAVRVMPAAFTLRADVGQRAADDLLVRPARRDRRRPPGSRRRRAATSSRTIARQVVDREVDARASRRWRRGARAPRPRASAEARTAVRVRMTVWAISGRVSSLPSAAAAAAKAGTPGVTSRRCRARRAGASARRSRRRATGRRNGPARRHGRRRARAAISAMISSRCMGAVSITRAPAGASRDDLARHQRAGIEADRAALDQAAARAP